MTLRMLDSITVADLPPGAPCYAGYVDGDWATWDELVATFPRAHLLSIAVFAPDDADCLDVENGDATLAQVYGWFVRQQDRGVWRPCIYTSAANLTALLDTMAANGFGRSSFRVWSAHYDAGEHICGPSSCGYPAADGTQWRDDAPGVGGAWVDESLLLDSFFPAPKPPPTTMEPDMIQLDPARQPHSLVFSGSAKTARFFCHSATTIRVDFLGMQPTAHQTLGFAAKAVDIPLNGCTAAVLHVDSGTALIGYTEV